MPGANANVRGLGGFVWSIAEILRGDFKQSEYGKVILPFIVLRRLDCILAATKQDVLEAAKGLSDAVDDPTKDMILFAAAGDNIKPGFPMWHPSAKLSVARNRSKGKSDGLCHQDHARQHEIESEWDMVAFDIAGRAVSRTHRSCRLHA